MRRQKKYHYIYRTTCQITGKFYVGMHSTDNPDDGYLGSGKILGYSRKKHGDENHKREILEHLPTREMLKTREKEIVNEELLADPLNINLKYGGEGGFDHQNLDAGVQSAKGCKGNARMRVLRETDSEWVENKAAAISIALKRAYAAGTKTPTLPDWNGRTHNAVTKSKIGVANSRRQRGEGNSQFGTCWVTNKVETLKIKKEHLDSYLHSGYERGRTTLF